MRHIAQEAHDHAARWLGQGHVADYIPELAKKEPHQLGVCITDFSGKSYAVGDSQNRFTIQSIAKVILLATALADVGFDEVFSRVGMEPTGDPFNSIIRLESVTSKPLNPMINAGAIAVTSCITGENAEARFQRILDVGKKLLGNDDLTYDRSVFDSENRTGDRNRALAYMMRSTNIFGGDVNEHLEVYFKACSLLTNCEEISYLGAVLAGDGKCPNSKKVLVEPFYVKVIRSLMTTCGMYDASGEFAIRVGIPAKSGVGGGIMTAVPGRMGIGVFSPGLDARGNSFCGIKALEYLSSVLDLSVF
ncbi:MAG: glutaminase A [Candidatus Fimivivens sp.]